MNYNLFKGKTLLGTFPSYEKARQFARMDIRSNGKKARATYNKKAVTKNATSAAWDRISRNPPSVKFLGYRIVRVD